MWLYLYIVLHTVSAAELTTGDEHNGSHKEEDEASDNIL